MGWPQFHLTSHAMAENSARRLSRFKTTLVALTLVLSIGLHWPLLQSVAWLNMIVCFSKEQGFQQAVVTTFSGKHPCQLCKLVSAGQKAEKKQTKETNTTKFDVFAFSVAPYAFNKPISLHFPEPVEFLEERICSPLAPPPDFV